MIGALKARVVPETLEVIGNLKAASARRFLILSYARRSPKLTARRVPYADTPSTTGA